MAPTIDVHRNGRSHWYELNGRRVPGVTTLIKGGLPAPGLMFWAANQAAEYAVDHPDLVDQLGRDDAYDVYRRAPWNRRDRAAVFGTDIHRLAAQLAENAEVEVPAVQAAHVDQCLTFWEEHDVEVLFTERPVASETWAYCGTFDVIAETKHGRALIDYKTGASGVYPEVALQLAAYRHAEWVLADNGAVLPMPDVDLCAVCWLRGDGYDLYPVTADERTFNLFLHSAAVAQGAERIAETFLGAPL